MEPSANCDAPEPSNEDGASISPTSDSESSDDPPGLPPAADTAPPRGLILKWYAADLKPPVQWDKALHELGGLAWWPTSTGDFYSNTLGPVLPVPLYMSCRGMKNLPIWRSNCCTSPLASNWKVGTRFHICWHTSAPSRPVSSIAFQS